MPRGAGRTAAAPPVSQLPALARPGPLQRPAAHAPRPAARHAARPRGQPDDLRRRHARGLRGLPPEARGRQSSFGEIAVMQRDLGGALERPRRRAPGAEPDDGGGALVSRPVAPAANRSPRPASAYNPTVSGDGTRIAFERAPGNNNFAKRYGRIGDVPGRPVGGRAEGRPPPEGARTSRSRPTTRSCRPTGGTSRSRRSATAGASGSTCATCASSRRTASPVALRDRGRRFADVYEPSMTADGRRSRSRASPGACAAGAVTRACTCATSAAGRLTRRSPPGAAGLEPADVGRRRAGSPTSPAGRCR